jgi:hypothetical protein
MNNNKNLVSLDELYKIIKIEGLNKYINSYGYSKKKDKKYYVILKDNTVIHFGNLNYEDYLLNGSEEKRYRFRSRFRSLYEKNKNNLYSPILWSWRVLW